MFQAVLTNAAQQDWAIKHVDVKSAYLNAPLKGGIFMKPPRGELEPGQKGKVLRLLKGLYSLKQAGREWYLEMARVLMKDMKELEFKQSRIYHSFFYHMTEEEHTIITVATDEMAIMSKREINANNFKSKIKWFWDITDHGPIEWFLGFKIRQNKNERTLLINQQAYIEMMVKKLHSLMQKELQCL